jgi:hypothetical protein
MAIPARINIVTLGVDDLDRSIAFYEALGWERASSSIEGVICWFRTGGSWLGLFGRADLAEDAGVPDTPDRGFSGVTLAINLERDEDVQPALDQAAAAGGTVVKPATAAVFGSSGYFADPDGHLWEVAYNPGFPLDAEGRIAIA